jgi:hypothetical protein
LEKILSVYKCPSLYHCPPQLNISSLFSPHSPSPNDEASIKVLSNVDIKQFTYQVFGSSQLLVSKLETFPEAKEHTITLKVTQEMRPTFVIVVFYLTDDGEVISSQIQMSAGGRFANFVS